MADQSFDLYDREKQLLAEGKVVLGTNNPKGVLNYSKRLYKDFSRVVRENEDLTRHSDRQERRLVKLNKNLKIQTKELDSRKTELEELSGQLGKYLPPQIHEALFRGDYDTKVATQRKKLTVFFSDIKNFTQISESLQPEALTDYLNEYFSEMTKIAVRHGGTIDKYIGDAMMVFFGDPESKGERDDARSCVLMAIEMHEKLQQLQHNWRKRGFENPFEVRMGINTGYCNVGNFGSEQRLTYTIIGGEVNVAQRLEANAPVGGILMSYETFAHVQDLVEAEQLKAMRMKGIGRDIKVFSVKARKNNGVVKLIEYESAKGVSISIDLNSINRKDRSGLARQLKMGLKKIEEE
ncbi:MAG: hypothetical protein CMK56_04220 [Proteobacteria bacterium]|nr:hypothetical protein [Pseudomonadota bacterium]